MSNTISFPNLFGGISFHIERVAFTILGVNVYWYGIIIASGFLLCLMLALKSAPKYGIKQDNIIDVLLIATPIAIICARLYYVIFALDEFEGEFWQIFNIRNGGLAIYGAVIGSFFTAYLYCKYKGIRPLRLFDFFAPLFPLAQAIGRWGNFVNQEAFGTNTTLPWGMTGDGIQNYLAFKADELASMGIVVNPANPIHPTFLYESIWNFIVFFILLKLRKKKKVEGEVFFMYMALYGLGRLWIEGLRTDSLMIMGLRASQFIAGVFAVVFILLFIIRRYKYYKKRGGIIADTKADLEKLVSQVEEDDNNDEKMEDLNE